MPIAVCGFWLIPDSPANTRVKYFKEEDHEVAVSRLVKIGRAKAAGITWNKIKAVASHWPMWGSFRAVYVSAMRLKRSKWNLLNQNTGHT